MKLNQTLEKALGRMSVEDHKDRVVKGSDDPNWIRAGAKRCVIC